MASFIVDTSQVLSAQTGADSVWIQSGGAGDSTVYGLAGNDTITFEGVNDASSLGTVVRLGEGDDTVTLGSATFSAGNVALYAGAGADTITVSGGTLSTFNTNEGNDWAILTGGTVLSASTFAAGSDTINISGSVDQLGMGNGHDVVSGSLVIALTGASITLGDGRDTVAIGILSGASAINFFGDNGSNFNFDLIELAGDTGTNGFVLKGRGGSDTITISGVQASSNIQGNDGADSIALSAGVEGINAGIVIGGGKGDDTIYGIVDSGALYAASADIFGGAGNDSIYLDMSVVSGGDATALNIIGGAGSDTITFNQTLSGWGNAEAASLQVSSLSESNLSAMDLVVALSGAAALDGSGAVTFTIDFANSASVNTVGATSAAADFGDATAYATQAASGLVTFNGTLPFGSSITAAMEAVDTLTYNNGGEGAALLRPRLRGVPVHARWC